MKKAIASLLFLFVVSAPIHGADWTIIAKQLEKSLVTVTSAKGSCTGFVIDQEKGYILTAGHCEAEDGKELLVDGVPAGVMAKDKKKDLLVLHVRDIDKPALRLAKDDPTTGLEVASYGYGYALEKPIFRVTHVSGNGIYIPSDGIGGPLVAVDTTFVPGMSGGPVVNAAGEVVMIVQMGTESVGLGVGSEVIKGKVGRYFGQPGKP